MSIYILGISAYYHDSAACIVKDGEVLAAAQEERFTRVKNDSSFPINSIRYCLSYANNSLENIDYIVYYEDSKIKFISDFIVAWTKVMNLDRFDLN